MISSMFLRVSFTDPQNFRVNSNTYIFQQNNYICINRSILLIPFLSNTYGEACTDRHCIEIPLAIVNLKYYLNLNNFTQTEERRNYNSSHKVKTFYILLKNKKNRR